MTSQVMAAPSPAREEATRSGSY